MLHSCLTKIASLGTNAIYWKLAKYYWKTGICQVFGMYMNWVGLKRDCLNHCGFFSKCLYCRTTQAFQLVITLTLIWPYFISYVNHHRGMRQVQIDFTLSSSSIHSFICLWAYTISCCICYWVMLFHYFLLGYELESSIESYSSILKATFNFKWQLTFQNVHTIYRWKSYIIYEIGIFWESRQDSYLNDTKMQDIR